VKRRSNLYLACGFTAGFLLEPEQKDVIMTLYSFFGTFRRRRKMKRQSILVWTMVAVSVLVFPMSSLMGEVRYDIIDLGDGIPYSISNNEQIVGESGGRATLFDPTGNQNNLDLGMLPDGVSSQARSVNDNGEIVGRVILSTGYSRATMFDPTGQGNNIDLLGPPIVCSSRAYSINNSGQVVGSRNGKALQFDSTGQGNHISLSGRASEAYSISNNEQIVGYIDEPFPAPTYATLFSSGDLRLGTVGGAHGWAYSINDSAQIVGWSRNTFNQERATSFDPTGEHNNINLGTLGGIGSRALSNNNNGEIVGWAYNIIGQQHATMFDPTGSGNNIDLNDSIDPASGWTLNIAYSINDSGWIVGTGSNGAFLLKPLFPVCTDYPVMDFNKDCKVDFQDFAIFSQNWLECNFANQEHCWE
jgi:uncharacterized membrane protein